MSTIPAPSTATPVAQVETLLAKLAPEKPVDTSILTGAVAIAKISPDTIPPADVGTFVEKVEVFKAKLNSRMDELVLSVQNAYEVACGSEADKEIFHSLLSAANYLTSADGVAIGSQENLEALEQLQISLKEKAISHLVDTRPPLQKLTDTIAYYETLDADARPSTANQTLYGHLMVLDNQYTGIPLKERVLSAFYFASRDLWVAAGSPAGKEPGGDNWSAFHLADNPKLLQTIIEKNLGVAGEDHKTAIGAFQVKVQAGVYSSKAAIEKAIDEVKRTIPNFTQDAIFGKIWADNACKDAAGNDMDARDWIFTGGADRNAFRVDAFCAAVQAVLKTYAGENILDADLVGGLDYERWEDVHLMVNYENSRPCTTNIGALECIVKESLVEDRPGLEELIHSAKMDFPSLSDDAIFGKVWANNTCKDADGNDMDARDWVFTGGEGRDSFRKDAFLQAFYQVVSDLLKELPEEIRGTIDLTKPLGIEDAALKYNSYLTKTVDTKKKVAGSDAFQLNLATVKGTEEPFSYSADLGYVPDTMTPGYYNKGDDYRMTTSLAKIRLPATVRAHFPIKLQEILEEERVQKLDVSIHVGSTIQAVCFIKEGEVEMNTNILGASERKLNFAPHGWAQPTTRRGEDKTKDLKMGVFSPSGMEETGSEEKSHGSGLRFERVIAQDNHVHPSADGFSTCLSPDNALLKMQDGAPISSAYSLVIIEENGVKKALVTYHWILNDQEPKRAELVAEIKKATNVKTFLDGIASVDDSGLTKEQKEQMQSLLSPGS